MTKYKYIGTEEQLIENGFEKSHVAVLPTALVKIIDDNHVIEICMDGNGRYNGDPKGKDLELLNILKEIKSEKQKIMEEIKRKEKRYEFYKENATRETDLVSMYKKELDDLNAKLKQLES
ncbi:MAG: hypothetical protein AB7E61_07185 [Acholeplasmataceae bacterium]